MLGRIESIWKNLLEVNNPANIRLSVVSRYDRRNPRSRA